MSDLHHSPEQAARTLGRVGQRRGVEQASPEYPDRLARVRDCPKSFDVVGSLGEHRLAVAIVGARAATESALTSAAALSRDLAAAGALVVSGGAVGIDAAAHRNTLDTGGATWAVLGSGLDVLYPEANHSLFRDIVAGGGALLSPFPAAAPPRRGHFVKRNRMIAGLADAVVVIDAGAGSGALHTARAASDYGRVVGAVPGAVGCDRLIGEGAAVVTNAADLLAALDQRPRRPAVGLPEPDSEPGRVLAALDRSPRDRDDIADRVDLDPSVVARSLLALELDGLVSLLPGHHYVRSRFAEQLANHDK